MFGHRRNQLVHPAPGAEDERQQMRICYTSSLEKSALLLEIRKISGSYVEPSAQSFWAQCSDKGPSIQHLRPKIQPIYQIGCVKPSVPVEKVWTSACCFPLDGSTRFFGGTGWKEENNPRQNFEVILHFRCFWVHS